MNPNFSLAFLTHWLGDLHLRDCIYKSRRLRGIFVQHSVKCVYVAQYTTAGWKQETFLVARQEGEFPTQLIKCLEMLRQAFFGKPDVKTNEERGVHYMSHTQSLLLVRTLQAPSWGAEPHFPPLLLIASVHTFICPTSHPLASQLSIKLWRTRESLHFSKAQLVVLLFLLSSIRRPLLALSLGPSIKKKDPQCWRMSPELIDGCTVLRNVGEV